MGTNKKGKTVGGWRVWAAVIMLGLLGLAVARNWDQFVESVQTVRSISGTSLLLMALLFAVTNALAALGYWFLALKKVSYRAMYAVEVAAAGVNRLLPAGVGSMGLHGMFLHRQKHTVPQATAVVSVNNALGLLTHVAMLALIFTIDASSLGAFNISWPSWLPVALATIAVGTVVIANLPSTKRRTKKFLHNFWQSIELYGSRLRRVVGAAVSSLGITLVNVLIFWTAAQAVGIQATGVELFLIYTVGVIFGSVTPTPGGLGGVEAGLMAGLVAKGVPVAQALAAALTFRLATFWLPLLIGPLALIYVRKNRLV